MTTTEATPDRRMLPDVPYITGSGMRLVHAVGAAAAWAALESCGGRLPYAPSLCGREYVIVSHGTGAAYRDPGITGGLCEPCAWYVACERWSHAALAAEIARVTPSAADQVTMAPDLDPMLAVSTIEAIIAAAWKGSPGAHDLGHPATAELLALVAAHRPVIYLPEECADGCCAHERQPALDDHLREAIFCTEPEAAVSCAACTLHSGEWAGDWAGQARVPVTAPCAVLLAAARRYGTLRES